MLFSPTTSSQHEEETTAVLSHQEQCAIYTNETIAKELHEAIPKLVEGFSYHVELGNKWYLHHLVTHCIGLIGASELHFATYAIKQLQANLFCDMLQSGLITEINSLCDYRQPLTDAVAFSILEQNCKRFGLKRCHAKIVCLRNEHHAVTITSSANFTSNTKLDVAVITVNKSITQARIQWIHQHINTCN